jgi:bacterioferritin-associated ferredoxin
MIVCSCNRIEQRDVERSYGRAVAARGGVRPTPGAIFRALGCRPNCGGCFPLIARIIHEIQERSQPGFPGTATD